MAQTCYIGIDQGSSSTKIFVISGQGQVLFQTKRPLPSPIRTGERIENAALEIVASIEEVLKEAVQSVKNSGFAPAAIGLSCQRSSCLIWDHLSGEPLSPVISWRDMRGSGFVQQIREKSEWVFETTGLPLTPYYSASKLRWLKENVPTAANRETTVFGTLSSFLVQRLTRAKKAVIDHTHAARTQLMNIRTLGWDEKLLEMFGLPGIRLPEIVPVIYEFGAIETGAGPVPLRACIGDQQSAMVGLGVLELGDGGINYGTGAFLIVNTGTELLPAKGMMASIEYSTGQTRHYLLEGSVNAAGDALEWLRGAMKLFKDYDEVDDLCWQATNDLIAFIGLNGTGAPHWENVISSSVHGISPGSSDADIVRAAVEGIAFFIKDIAEEIRKTGLETRGFAVSGGLSALSYLVQVQADILNKEMRMSAEQEVSALGSALLAGMAQGEWTTEAIKKMAAPGETILPRRNAGAEKRYRRWKELHRMARQLDQME